VTVDDITGDIRNNAAIVPAGSLFGGISAITNGATDLVIDINGYYTPTNALPDANPAFGAGALSSNSTGFQNTGIGVSALLSNTTGNNNTAVGFDALEYGNGSGNTATGAFALQNTSGTGNAAFGTDALEYSTSASNNTAVGYETMYASETGNGNTAVGPGVLVKVAGDGNTAVGNQALPNATGKYNLALGQNAGEFLQTGDVNIYIANAGVDGESNTTRIGADGNQTRTFISGIQGVATGTGDGTEVIIYTNGQFRHHQVIPALQRRHPRHGRCFQRSAAAAARHFPLQEAL
jgi:hypothetical protein